MEAGAASVGTCLDSWVQFAQFDLGIRGGAVYKTEKVNPVIRSKVELPFRWVKFFFGYTKFWYQGSSPQPLAHGTPVRVDLPVRGLEIESNLRSGCNAP